MRFAARSICLSSTRALTIAAKHNIATVVPTIIKEKSDRHAVLWNWGSDNRPPQGEHRGPLEVLALLLTGIGKNGGAV